MQKRNIIITIKEIGIVFIKILIKHFVGIILHLICLFR